ncbi:MAG: DNA-binding response regulator [Betaproteobacteria bacterium RIFCSPLOWO2_12_FULL_62_58]|nr:MAG: DNA-binding response regulator [Betaproteobacteria bacterium RIFCSPLOWO2_12_FULL_62_58]
MTEARERPLRVVIVDDEAPARSRMRDVLADCAQQLPLTVEGEAESGRAALALLAQRKADVVLLDIRMPEMDGIEVAQHLQKLDDPPAVIFTTAYNAYAIRAFEVHAVDYLLKPIRASRLREALLRLSSAARPKPETLRELQPGPRAFLSAQERGRIHLIPIGDIIYLKAELKYVTARTAMREYLIEESLMRLEQEYAERFVRVHRNCLVAKDAIRGFERAAGAGGEGHWVVVLNACDEKFAVSRRQQHIVRELGR